MPGLNLPYTPIRQQLYTRTEIFQGFDHNEPMSWAQTVDFAIYRYFIMEGETQLQML